MFEIFPVGKVNRMRKKLEAARATAGETITEDGWHKSDISPNTLLDTIDCLWLKEGYTLRAYLYKAGENGNGIVWAMPIDSPFPEPSECARLTERFLDPPRPEHSLDDFMEAIDGDHTMWSYMCASILSRELFEFGARWHGCEWSDERIVSFRKTKKSSRNRAVDQSLISQKHFPLYASFQGRHKIRFMTINDQSGTLTIHNDLFFNNSSYESRHSQLVRQIGPGYVS